MLKNKRNSIPQQGVEEEEEVLEGVEGGMRGKGEDEGEGVRGGEG